MPGGRGAEAVCPGARLRVQVTVACMTEPAEDGIHGAPLLCDGPCSGTAVDRCRTCLTQARSASRRWAFPS